MRPMLLAACLLLAGCAGRSAVAVAPASPPIDVRALIASGCYRCLEEAFAAASQSADRPAAFEAAILLVLRAKELGLPPGGWLAAARTQMPTGPDWPIYLEIVSIFPRDELADDRGALQTESIGNRRSREIYDGWRTTLAGGSGSPILRAYLDLSIACRPDVGRADFQSVRDGAVASVLAQHGTGAPLLRYMLGRCGGEAFDQLAAVPLAEPRFVDAELELGRREMRRRPRPDIPEALRRLGLAAAAFPESPVPLAALARVHESREQWIEALARWDEVIALVPGHGDALMGRTIALSQLLRHDEAVAASTRVLDTAPTHRADAFYWRAWNQFRLMRHDQARDDADAAKALSVSAPLFLLSGMIEWELQRPESAEEEFLETLVVDLGMCEAASYLGGVRLELRKWPGSLAAFQQAQRCYQLALTLRRQVIASLSATPEDVVANAWEIASHERAIAAATDRHDEAAQNIAALQKFLAGTP